MTSRERLIFYIIALVLTIITLLLAIKIEYGFIEIVWLSVIIPMIKYVSNDKEENGEKV